jgi:transcriptional regulator with XRE-family HTH domain
MFWERSKKMEAHKPTKEHNIGGLIKFLLKKKSLSMRKLGSFCGMDVATISRIVNGKQKPKFDHLQRFSMHLDISLDKLLEASGYKDDDGNQENVIDFRESIDGILELLGDSKLFDLNVTRARIEQELTKYEHMNLQMKGIT